MIKTIFLSILIIFLAGIYVYSSTRTPCNTSLAYSIGTVDDRFGISKEDFLKVLAEAEEIWEGKTGIELFNYKKDASFKINLKFDDRQEKFLRQNELFEDINGNSENLDNRQYELKQKIANYESMVRKLEADADFYKRSGGASQLEFDQFEIDKEEAKGLGNEIARLSSDYNIDAKRNNKNINIYKSSFDDEFISQGVYTGNEINIYQFKSRDDIRMLIAHEMGHALGIKHIENSYSLMHYLSRDQDQMNMSLTVSDVLALKSLCNKGDKLGSLLSFVNK